MLCWDANALIGKTSAINQNAVH